MLKVMLYTVGIILVGVGLNGYNAVDESQHGLTLLVQVGVPTLILLAGIATIRHAKRRGSDRPNDPGSEPSSF